MNKKEITQFEVIDNEVYMNGLINTKTYDQFVKIIDENPQITTIVEVNVEGSIDDDTMIKLSYYIREKGLNTKLLFFSDINSGGVDLFLSGVERTMEKGAHIGVHSWSDGFKEAKEFPKDAPEHEQNRKYIEVMLGKDDFYWFTIYAAPANGIYEMTEKEIETYGLLTQPIIINDTKNNNVLPATMLNKMGKAILGNFESDTVIINAQGGPVLNFDLDTISHLIKNNTKINMNTTMLINVHQEQTLSPWKFKEEEITFEEAKEYDKKSVERLVDVITYFKNEGKKVFVIGISFGAFVVQDSIAEYGNIADEYLIMVGRLHMPYEVWNNFSQGKYVGFEYDEKGTATILEFNAKQAGMGGSGSIEDINMAKLAAGLGYKRYISLLKDTDLSNVVYAYGKTDEQVGRLSKEEVEFLQSKNATVLESDGNHWETVSNFIGKGTDLLLNK